MAAEKRLLEQQRPFYEAYNRWCQEHGLAGVESPKDFSMDRVLKLNAKKEQFEYSLTEPGKLCHYSILSDGSYTLNDRGEFLAVLNPETGMKRYVHYSQVYGVEDYVLSLLDTRNIVLAISYQTIALSIALLNDYMAEAERINDKVSRLSEIYRQMNVAEINSAEFPQKMKNGKAERAVFIQLEKATVRAMQDLGIGLKDAEVIYAARVKPIFAYWHEGVKGDVSASDWLSDTRTTHYQWHMPILDRRSGRLYPEAIRICAKHVKHNNGYLYDQAPFAIEAAKLRELAEKQLKRESGKTLQQKLDSMDYKINSYYLNDDGRSFKDTILDEMQKYNTLYAYIKAHRTEQTEKGIPAFFVTDSGRKVDGLAEKLEENPQSKVKDLNFDLFDYQEPVFPDDDYTPETTDLLTYLNQEAKVLCQYLSGNSNSGAVDDYCPNVWGAGENSFTLRSAILPTWPDKYVYITAADVRNHKLNMSEEPLPDECLKFKGSISSATTELKPRVNTADAVVKRSLNEILNDPALQFCYVGIEDVDGSQEVLRQDIDRLVTEMQIPNNTVSHENNTMQMILQLASNIIENLGEQLAKINRNVRV